MRNQEETKISEGYNLVNGAKLWYQMMRNSWSRGHAKTPIHGKPSKSGLIGVWHKDKLYLGISTIGNGKPPLNEYWFANEIHKDDAMKPVVLQ